MRPAHRDYSAEVVSESHEMTFGQFLRRERVLRGISREEILRVTKVSPDYYEALESNRFGQLPPKAFVVGFLRVLSRYAGLDSDEVVNRFLAEVSSGGPQIDESDGGFWRRHYRKLLMYCGVMCLLILIFAPLFRHVE
ncbi:MAG: helix-turn-helix transcriptional regulator [Pseudomonadota bacterium]